MSSCCIFSFASSFCSILFRFRRFLFFSCTGGGSVRWRAPLWSRPGRAGVRDDGHVGAAAVLHLRLPDVGHAHPYRNLRGDQHRHVLLPALRRGLPLVSEKINSLTPSLLDSFFFYNFA